MLGVDAVVCHGCGVWGYSSVMLQIVVAAAGRLCDADNQVVTPMRATNERVVQVGRPVHRFSSCVVNKRWVSKLTFSVDFCPSLLWRHSAPVSRRTNCYRSVRHVSDVLDLSTVLANTQGASDAILSHIYASWFLPPSCRQKLINVCDYRLIFAAIYVGKNSEKCLWLR